MDLGNFTYFAHDVEKFYSEFKKRGVIINRALLNRDYGIQGFDISDPNEHVLTLEQGSE